MNTLHDIDLRQDPEAALYVKDETVQVRFADTAGEVMSPEGPNRYTVGDALVTGSTGNRWCVSRARFAARYEPVPPLAFGEDGAYRNRPLPVLARPMHEPFAIARSAGGDLLRGEAGDWLMQYAPGDYGITEGERFRQVYRPAETPAATVYALYRAFRTGDHQAFAALCTEDLEWVQNPGFPGGATRHGPDAVVEGVFKALGDEWERFAYRIEEVLEAGQTVIVTGAYEGRHRGTGKAMRAAAAHVYDLRGSKVCRFRMFADTKTLWDAMV